MHTQIAYILNTAHCVSSLPERNFRGTLLLMCGLAEEGEDGEETTASGGDGSGTGSLAKGNSIADRDRVGLQALQPLRVRLNLASQRERAKLENAGPADEDDADTAPRYALDMSASVVWHCCTRALRPYYPACAPHMSTIIRKLLLESCCFCADLLQKLAMSYHKHSRTGLSLVPCFSVCCADEYVYHELQLPNVVKELDVFCFSTDLLSQGLQASTCKAAGWLALHWALS